MSDNRLYCAVCNDVVGVYEPAVVVDRSRARHTSRALEPSLRQGEDTVMHRHCAAAAHGWDSPDA